MNYIACLAMSFGLLACASLASAQSVTFDARTYEEPGSVDPAFSPFRLVDQETGIPFAPGGSFAVAVMPDHQIVASGIIIGPPPKGIGIPPHLQPVERGRRT